MSKDPFDFDNLQFTNSWSEQTPYESVESPATTSDIVEKSQRIRTRLLLAVLAVGLVVITAIVTRLVMGAGTSTESSLTPGAGISSEATSPAESPSIEVVPSEAPSPTEGWSAADDLTARELSFVAAVRKSDLAELRLFLDETLADLGHSICDGRKGKLKDWEIVKRFVSEWQDAYPSIGDAESVARLLLGNAKKYLC